MEHRVKVEVQGPWSLATSKAFWEGFAPAALAEHGSDALKTSFVSDSDWSSVHVTVAAAGSITQDTTAGDGSGQDTVAELLLSGDGDLEAASRQVQRFLSLDVDARAWPEVGERDPVIASAQQELAGLRPCGFHSPYEAAAWSVLSQRVPMTQAAAMRATIIEQHGERGAFPSPAVLQSIDLDLPGRKAEYLHAVAEAALDGPLDGESLRAMTSADAMASVQRVKGLGPFAAELVVIRGALAPDVVPTQEKRLADEITRLYGPQASLSTVSHVWSPFRSWACLYLRALAERHH